MGLSQSADKPKSVPISSKFSTVELQKLEEFFKFKDSAPTSTSQPRESVQNRISNCFVENISRKISKYLEKYVFDKSADQSNGDSQETLLIFVFHLTKDCVKELAEIIFQVAAEEDEIMTRDELKMFLVDFIDGLSKGMPESSTGCLSADMETSNQLAEKLVEHCPEKLRKDEFDVVLHRTPLLVDLLQYKFRMVFFDYVGDVSEEVQASMPFLVPKLEIKDKADTTDLFILSLASLVYINSKVPTGLQHKWRLLYSTKLHGESFSKLTGAIVDQGPTVLVIRDTDGHVFGGYASESWQYSSQFQGTDKSFLFTTKPSLNVYDCMGGSYNDHYMYLNIGQETMPNGLGMGGQFDFFGLWIDHEFGEGHSKAKPLCTTYKSPQLSMNENFKIEAVNVWGVGEEPKKLQDEEYNEDMTSVLDKHIEAKALLEIAGKPRVSEGLRDAEPDSDIPETKELQHAHDPMS